MGSPAISALLVDYHTNELDQPARRDCERQLAELPDVRRESDEIAEILSLCSSLGERFCPPDATWAEIESACWALDRLVPYHMDRLAAASLAAEGLAAEGLAAEGLAAQSEAPRGHQLSTGETARVELAVSRSPVLAAESAEIAAALAAWRAENDAAAAASRLEDAGRADAFAPTPAGWAEIEKRIAAHDDLVDYHREELPRGRRAAVERELARSAALTEASDDVARVLRGVQRLGDAPPPAGTWDAIALRLAHEPPPPPEAHSERTGSRLDGSLAGRPPIPRPRRIVPRWWGRLVAAGVAAAVLAVGLAMDWQGSSGDRPTARLLAGAAQVDTNVGATFAMRADQLARLLEPGDRLSTGDDRARVALGARAVLALDPQSEVELIAPGRLALRHGRILFAQTGEHRWTLEAAELECRLLGTEVELELDPHRTRVHVLDGAVVLRAMTPGVRRGSSGDEAGAGRQLVAGFGLELAHADAAAVSDVAHAVPFAIDAGPVRDGWRVEPVLGRLRIVPEPDANGGSRLVALLTLTNTTADRVQLVTAGSTRRCWLLVDAPTRRGAQLPIAFAGATADRDALEPGASHTFRIDVTSHFPQRGSYEVRARYLVGRSARDADSPAHSVTTPVVALRVE